MPFEEFSSDSSRLKSMLVLPSKVMDTEQEFGTKIEPKTDVDSIPIISEPVIGEFISISSSDSESFDLLEPNNESTGSSKDSFQANDSNQYNSNAKQSPPVQTMSWPDNVPSYDPNRIPLSVFASKPTSAMDWSVASNESLFSIHMGGNNSFSTDHAIFLSKSEELYNFDDLTSNSPCNLPTVIETLSDNDINYSPSLSIYDELSDEELSDEKGEDITSKACVDEVFEDNHKETTFSNISDGRDTPSRDGTRTSASTQRSSNESGTNSSGSFAFPVLAGEVVSNSPLEAVHENVQPGPFEIHENVQPVPFDKPDIEPQPDPPRSTQRVASTKRFSWFRIPSFSFPKLSLPTISCPTFSLLRCSCCQR